MISPKKKTFAEEYLIDLNATQAATRAGYSKKTAKSQGQRLLLDPDVHRLIVEAQEKRSERTEITQDMVLRELAKIGFSDIRRVVKWSPTLGEQFIGDTLIQTNGIMLIDSDKIDDDTAAAVCEISQSQQGLKIKLHDKQAALVNMGRHLGMFIDKINVGGQPDNPIIVGRVERVIIEHKNATDTDSASI